MCPEVTSLAIAQAVFSSRENPKQLSKHPPKIKFYAPLDADVRGLQAKRLTTAAPAWVQGHLCGLGLCPPGARGPAPCLRLVCHLWLPCEALLNALIGFLRGTFASLISRSALYCRQFFPQ